MRGLSQKTIEKLLESGRAKVVGKGDASVGRSTVKVGKRNLTKKPARDPLESEAMETDSRFSDALPRGLKTVARITETLEKAVACSRCGREVKDLMVFIQLSENLRRRVCLECASPEYEERVR